MDKKMIASAALAFAALAGFAALMCRSAGRLALETSALPGASRKHIIIDPGHGGEDGGAVCDGVIEKELNLAVSLDTADLLRLFGYDVEMTRSTDDALTSEGEDVRKRKYNDMRLRLDMYDSSEDNVVIGIHQNKFSDPSSNGAQVFYSPNNEGSGRLADCIRFSLKRLVQPGNERACKSAGSSIYLLKNTKNPAVLVECGFISNRAEREKLLDKEYQRQLALAIATGLTDYLNTQ